MIESLLAAVVANVASADVIRLRSADWLCPIAANTVPPLRTRFVTAVCWMSSTCSRSVPSAANVGRLPNTFDEVLIIALDHHCQLLLPLSERSSRGRVERVEDRVELDRG